VLENGFFGSPSSLLLQADLVRRAGGFPEDRVLQGSEDWCFLLRLTAAGVPIRVLAEPLVRYRVHASNTTGDPDSVARSMWAAVRWLADNDLVRDGQQRRLAARTAGVIGQAYAAHGRRAPAARWAGRSLAAGAPLEALRAVSLVAGTGARAQLRRH
jgi:hypothetical protein